MKLLDIQDEHKHCIKVRKVYDWVNRLVTIKEKETIEIPSDKKMFEDCICCDFKVKCNAPSPSTIWTGNGLKHITATLNIHLTSSCKCKLDIFINGKLFDSIKKGQSFCATVSDLEAIEVQCTGNTQCKECCCGEIRIFVHYGKKFGHDLNIKNATCFLSDEYGNPLDLSIPDAILCEELVDEGRKDIPVTLPNGKKVTLQQVTILKSGFVTVKFWNHKKEVCKVCTFPFSEVETFYLCAPPGTKVECEITDFECKVFIAPQGKKHSNCIKILLTIHICQSIQVVGVVKVEVKGVQCHPRQEIEADVECPTLQQPMSCPLLTT